MGRKDQSPPVSPEARVAAQIALQKLNHLSVQAAHGDIAAGAVWIYSLIPPGQDEPPEIHLEEKALDTLSPRERFALTFAGWWAREFGDNFGFDCQFSPTVLSQLYQEKIGPFTVGLARSVQGILHPTGEFGQSVVANMIQTNDGYRALVDRAIQLSK